MSDVDALLGGLDRLIAKKRDLKQAAMQQLLTGQTRLPGFHGEWEVKRLGRCRRHRERRDRRSTTASAALHAAMTFLGDVDDIDGRFRADDLDARVHSTITKLQAKRRRICCRVSAASIGKTSRATIGECCGRLMSMRSVMRSRHRADDASTRVPRLPDSTIQTCDCCDISTQAARFGLIGSKISSAFEIAVATDPTEQTAIAAVLSDMDAELAALEARRDKTRALKQAMMQELLTGRTRLGSGWRQANDTQQTIRQL